MPTPPNTTPFQYKGNFYRTNADASIVYVRGSTAWEISYAPDVRAEALRALQPHGTAVRTVSAFLETPQARAAAEFNGNGDITSFVADGGGRVARKMSGAYSADELATLLDDTRRVQAACNVWRGIADNCAWPDTHPKPCNCRDVATNR